jgi:hypothetical protein
MIRPPFEGKTWAIGLLVSLLMLGGLVSLRRHVC